MSQMFSAYPKVKSIRNMSLEIKFPSSIPKQQGVIIGAMGFRNAYDGHTVELAL